MNILILLVILTLLSLIFSQECESRLDCYEKAILTLSEDIQRIKAENLSLTKQVYDLSILLNQNMNSFENELNEKIGIVENKLPSLESYNDKNHNGITQMQNNQKEKADQLFSDSTNLNSRVWATYGNCWKTSEAIRLRSVLNDNFYLHNENNVHSQGCGSPNSNPLTNIINDSNQYFFIDK